MKRTRTEPLHLPQSLIVGVDDRGMSDHAVRAAVDLGPQLGASVELLHAVRVPILEWMGSDVTKGPIALGQALENAEPAVNEHVRQLLDSTPDGGSRRLEDSPRAADFSPRPTDLSSRAGDASSRGAGGSSRPADDPSWTAEDSSRTSDASRTSDVSSRTSDGSARTPDVGSPSQASGTAFSSRTSAAVSLEEASDLRVRVVPGTPTEVLLSEAQRVGSAVIFLGKHEKRGLVDFGSTARAVLAKGAVPVWVQTGTPRPIRRIVAAVDLSQDSLRALSFACLLGAQLGATVRAVHFFDVGALFASITPDPLGFTPAISVLDVRTRVAAEFERVMETFDWRGADHLAEVRDGKAEEGLVELGAESDLIVLGTHGRTGLALGVLGGVAHAVLKQSEAPVLAVPFPSRRFRI